MKIGFAVRELDLAVSTYINVLGHRTCWTRPVADWRLFYAWVRSLGVRPLDTVVVTDMAFVPFLDYTRMQLGSRVVCLTLDEPCSWLDADANYESYDLGWGVDRTSCQKLGYRREWMRQPVFFLTEDAPEIEQALLDMGHRVVFGSGGYVMGNVALVPGRRVVPHDIYTALASAMPVVTTAENSKWMEGVPSFESFLEDGIDVVAKEVADTDFKHLGMMAQEVVPGIATFKKRLLSKLTFK